MRRESRKHTLSLCPLCSWGAERSDVRLGGTLVAWSANVTAATTWPLGTVATDCHWSFFGPSWTEFNPCLTPVDWEHTIWLPRRVFPRTSRFIRLQGCLARGGNGAAPFLVTNKQSTLAFSSDRFIRLQGGLAGGSDGAAPPGREWPMRRGLSGPPSVEVCFL